MLDQSPQSSVTENLEAPSLNSSLATFDPTARDTITSALLATEDWHALCTSIESKIDPVFKYPLVIEGIDDTKQGKPTISLPVRASEYSAEKFRTSPGEVGPDDTVVSSVKFGYSLDSGFRHIGVLDRIVIGPDGSIKEVLAKRDEALQVFSDNVFGRELSLTEVKKIYELNAALISALREDPATNAALEKFTKGRKFLPEWSDHAKLAYYSPTTFDILRWGRENGYPREELYLAGFVERAVSGEGKVIYRNRSEAVVFIPFKNDEGELVLWRMRLENPKAGEPKYRSAPLDRAIDEPFSVHRELYQAELLRDIKGKDLVITEGEFKCLVSTQLTKFATVGITGITQVTDRIIEAIAEKEPRSVCVLLDNDPPGKGLSRVDGQTDSERAAYLIAKRLIRAGVENVTIGEVPMPLAYQIEEGKGKIGIDDYLLFIQKRGGDPKVAMKDIIAQASSPSEYESKKGIQLEMHDLFERRQAVKRTLRELRNHEKRSPLESPGGEEGGRISEDIAKLERMFSLLDEAFKVFLSEAFQGATRLVQPTPKHFSNLMVRAVPHQDQKRLLLQSGKMISPEVAKDDQISLTIYPRDLPPSQRLSHKEGFEFPSTMEDLTKEYRSEKSRVLRAQGVSYKEFVREKLAEWLHRKYPTDEYRYEKDVALQTYENGHWTESGKLPLAIFKENGKLQAVAWMPIWQAFNSHGAASRAGGETRREMDAARAFLRSPGLGLQKGKFSEILKTVQEVGNSQNQEEAAEIFSGLGISAETCKERGVVILKPDDLVRLTAELLNKSLVNQALHFGLFTLDKHGAPKSRFQGPIAVLPSRNISGDIVGIRVFPISSEDHTNGALPPVPKLVHHLDSPRSQTPTFDDTKGLFMEDTLKGARGKIVLVAPNELEGLALRSLVDDAGRRDVKVVALSGDLSLRESHALTLKNAEPSKVIFVGNPTVSSRYEAVVSPGEPAYIHDLFDSVALLREKDSGVQIAFVPTSAPLVGEFARHLPSTTRSSVIDTLISRSEVIDSTTNGVLNVNRSFHVDVTERFVTLLETLDKEVAMHTGRIDADLMGGVLTFLYSKVRAHGAELGGSLPSTFEEFLGSRYGCSGPCSVSELLMMNPDERASIPVYTFGKTALMYQGARWDHHSASVERLTDGAREREVSELPLIDVRHDSGFKVASSQDDSLTTSSTLVLNNLLQAVRKEVPLGEVKTSYPKISLKGGKVLCSLSVMVEEEEVKAFGSGNTKTDARESTVSELIKTLKNHPEFGELVQRLYNVVIDQDRQERELLAKAPYRDLRELAARLEKVGARLEITKESNSEAGVPSNIQMLFFVDGREFRGEGEGRTLKVARHSAASQILDRITGEFGEVNELVDRLLPSSAKTSAENDVVALDDVLRELRKQGHDAVKSGPTFREIEGETVGWECNLSIQVDTILYHGNVVGKGKKEAHQAACRSVLQKMESGELVEQEVQSDIAVSKLDSLQKPGVALLYEKISALLSRRIEVGQPNFDVTESKDPRGRYKCLLTVELAGKSHSAEGFGSKKKESEHAAASVLKEFLDQEYGLDTKEPEYTSLLNSRKRKLEAEETLSQFQQEYPEVKEGGAVVCRMTGLYKGVMLSVEAAKESKTKATKEASRLFLQALEDNAV